jgi:hypothetical protein
VIKKLAGLHVEEAPERGRTLGNLVCL